MRIIVGAVTTIALAFVIVFLILFFIFQSYVVDGELVGLPWLTEADDEMPTPTPAQDSPTPTPAQETPDPQETSLPEDDLAND